MGSYRKVGDDILKEWLDFREEELGSLTCKEDKEHFIYFEEISTDIKYSSLTEYLCEFIGASMPKNVVACAMDLAKFNHLLMGELCGKYEPVED